MEKTILLYCSVNIIFSWLLMIYCSYPCISASLNSHHGSFSLCRLQLKHTLSHDNKRLWSSTQKGDIYSTPSKAQRCSGKWGRNILRARRYWQHQGKTVLSHNRVTVHMKSQWLWHCTRPAQTQDRQDHTIERGRCKQNPTTSSDLFVFGNFHL